MSNKLIWQAEHACTSLFLIVVGKGWLAWSLQKAPKGLSLWEKLQASYPVSFTEERLPSGHSAIKPMSVECYSDGWPSGSYSHLHTGSLELSQSDHQVLGHLSYQGPSTPIAQLCWVASSRRSPGYFKLLPFKNYGATVLLGTFNAADFVCSLPQIYASTQSCLWALQAVPSTSWLGFSSHMHCQLWDLI